MLKKIFNQTVYIQVLKDSFNILDVENNQSIFIKSDKPFSTTRLAVGDFLVAESTLSKGLRTLFAKSFFRPSPIAVVHQLYLSEGGLCAVEKRVLKELAEGAGARLSYIWSGAELTREQLLSKIYVPKSV